MKVDDSIFSIFNWKIKKKILSQHVSGCHGLKNYLSEETNDLAGAISIVCQE